MIIRLLFLLLASISVSADENSEAIGSFIDLMNADRAVLSRSLQIANMWKLEYCEELEKIAEKIPIGSEYQHGINYRVHFIFPKKDTYSWENEVAQRKYRSHKYQIKKADENHDLELNPLEISLPLQTKIGCTERNVTFRNKQNEIMEYLGFCLLGPESTFDSWYANGLPGTQCGRNVNVENGLCVPEVGQCASKPTTTTDKPTTTTTTPNSTTLTNSSESLKILQLFPPNSTTLTNFSESLKLLIWIIPIFIVTFCKH